MPTAKEILLKELDRRITNVEKEAAWRKKNAEDYFESFKRYVAENLTLGDMESQATIVYRSQDAVSAYRQYSLVLAELNQLKALREDVEKGRVNLDA